MRIVMFCGESDRMDEGHGDSYGAASRNGTLYPAGALSSSPSDSVGHGPGSDRSSGAFS